MKQNILTDFPIVIQILILKMLILYHFSRLVQATIVLTLNVPSLQKNPLHFRSLSMLARMFSSSTMTRLHSTIFWR